MVVMKMPKYKFADIALNLTQKRKPTPDDMATYIGLEHLDSGSLSVTRWGSKVPIKGDKLIMQKGDVLFGKRNAYLRRAAIAPHDGLFSAHGMILRPNEKVISSKLFPFFICSDYFFDAAIRISVGSLSPTINWSALKELEFTLPDMNEQEKLAELFWAANDTKEAYKKLLNLTDELVKSQFIEMFYDKKYPVKTIGNVIDKNIMRVASVFDKGDEIHYLDISSIDNNLKRVIGTNPYLLKDAPSRAQYVLKKGDILYSTVRPNLQNIAINPYAENNIIGSTGFCVLRCNNVSTGYMWGVITSNLFTNEMITLANGANYPAVTDKIVHAFEIPVPPEEEQKRFERFVDHIDKSKFELQINLENLENTIKALMSKNFG